MGVEDRMKALFIHRYYYLGLSFPCFLKNTLFLNLPLDLCLLLRHRFFLSLEQEWNYFFLFFIF